MHRRLAKSFASLLVASLAVLACARVQLPVAGPRDVSRASVRWPGTSEGDLARGRSLYQGRCTSCHQPFLPGAVPAAEWPGHVHEMRERAHLSPEEADLVVRYLVTMASARASSR
jgi:mono/diheme cytochrome c family protein